MYDPTDMGISKELCSPFMEADHFFCSQGFSHVAFSGRINQIQQPSKLVGRPKFEVGIPLVGQGKNS